MDLDECSSTSALQRLIERILCESGQPLESLQLFEKVRELCGHEPPRALFRKALVALVKAGRIEKVRGDKYGKPRLLFKCKG